VAIALVPPISSVGIGLKTADLSLIINAPTVASMNILAVLISGYLCFRVLGLKPSTYYKKKQSEKQSATPVAYSLIRTMRTIFLRISLKTMQTSFSAINF